MKTLIDMAPALAFVAAIYLRDIYVATAVLIVAQILLVAYYGVVHRRLHKMHAGTAALVTVMGGITLAVHDPLFIKFKPTALYLVIAAVLAGSHVLGKKPLLQRFGESSLTLPDALWRRISSAWALYFLVCAVLNVVLVYTVDDKTWALAKTFGFTGLWIVFLLAHLPFVYRHLPQTQQES